MNKPTKYVLFLDIETTGIPITNNGNHDFTDNFKYDSSRIVSIAWILCDFKQNIIKKDYYIIKPKNFVIHNNKFHGITNVYALAYGTKITSIFKLLRKLDDEYKFEFIISHNLDFVMNILYNEMYRCEYNRLLNIFQSKTQKCMGILSKNDLKLNKTPTLNEINKYCFKKNMNKLYDAEYDVDTMMRSFFYLLHN